VYPVQRDVSRRSNPGRNTRDGRSDKVQLDCFFPAFRTTAIAKPIGGKEYGLRVM
jgi:hypothetical protein